MILKDNETLNYLNAYNEGKIKKGLDVGCLLDDFIRYKKGSFTMINGLDNVGKTRWILWYFLCLTKKHKLKWIIWSGENRAGQLKRDLIEMLTGEKLNNLLKSKVDHLNNKISKYFKIIDNSKLYSHKDLLNIFKKSDANGCLIDPFTGLNHDRRVNQFERNYQFCNDVREFCNQTGKTIYVNSHPQTEAARRVFPSDHVLAGHIQDPKKSDTEGGQSFANRADDFITIHRLISHPKLWNQTLIHIRKIKDTETGGKISFLDEPLVFDYNFGMGFTIGGINPLKQ